MLSSSWIIYYLILIFQKKLFTSEGSGRLLIGLYLISIGLTFIVFLGDPRIRAPMDMLSVVLVLDGMNRLVTRNTPNQDA